MQAEVELLRRDNAQLQAELEERKLVIADLMNKLYNMDGEDEADDLKGIWGTLKGTEPTKLVDNSVIDVNDWLIDNQNTDLF